MVVQKVGNLLTHLVNNEEKMQNTWRICHGKKAFDKRVVWDKQRKQALKIDIIYEPVWHPEHPDQPRGRYMKYPEFKML